MHVPDAAGELDTEKVMQFAFVFDLPTTQQRVGVARCRCAPRSPERLVGLLVVVVCVEKCGMSLMSSTCRGCGDGAR